MIRRIPLNVDEHRITSHSVTRSPAPGGGEIITLTLEVRAETEEDKRREAQRLEEHRIEAHINQQLLGQAAAIMRRLPELLERVFPESRIKRFAHLLESIAWKLDPPRIIRDRGLGDAA